MSTLKDVTRLLATGEATTGYIQAAATLALAEEQRLSNLIAWYGLLTTNIDRDRQALYAIDQHRLDETQDMAAAIREALR